MWNYCVYGRCETGHPLLTNYPNGKWWIYDVQAETAVKARDFIREQFGAHFWVVSVNIQTRGVRLKGGKEMHYNAHGDLAPLTKTSARPWRDPTCI